MKRLRKISREYYLRQIFACWVMCSMLLALTPMNIAMADTNPPPGAVPGSGDLTSAVGAGITGEAANWLQVTQTQNEAIMNWTNFDIGSSSTVDFLQPGAQAAILNRVSDASGTGIFGTINANGRVFIINPAGIVFGKSAIINVSQLVASSLDIADDDFLNGAPYEFIGGATAGDVKFYGMADNINAERLYLIGRNVFNYGGLRANDCVVMAAGDRVIITENPDSSVAVEAFMPEGWASGSGVHVVKNEAGEVTADESLAGVDGDGTAQVVLAAGDIWSAALVKAYSDGGSDAVATVDIDTAGNFLVEDKVIAEAVGNCGNNAIATINVDTGGNVDVIGGDGEASIQAETRDGVTNTSNVLICADGHLTVEAEGGFSSVKDEPYDSTASIKAIAQSWGAQNNTADVQIDTKEGVNVTALGAPVSNASASITAEAYHGEKNTANTLICSESNVKVMSEKNAGEPGTSSASIRSVAGEVCEGTSSAKTTVVSHQGDVVVDSSSGGNASIESEVLASPGTATTQIYATDVAATGAGSSIKAIGSGGEVVQKGDGFTFCATSDGRIAQTDGTATLIIDGSQSQDCPDCPPCECEGESVSPAAVSAEVIAPVAPLPPYYIPRIEGCPELTQAAAAELEIAEETLQVGMGNALALNPNIQPCQACASLVNAASILKDVDGSQMAAMLQVFNAMAPADAPYTPEMATSIAMAFEDAAEGSQYASAMEFIDAFVQYAAALDELGSPVGDSTAFVMDKYGAGLGDNSNMATFVAGRIASRETF